MAPTPAQLGRAPLQRRLGSLAINGSYCLANICFKCIDLVSVLNSEFDFDAYFSLIADQIIKIEDDQITQHLISNVTTSMPSALPTPNSAAIDDANNPLSPNLKKPFFRKNKGEDLNKYEIIY